MRLAGGEHDLPAGERARAIELVRRQHDSAPGVARARDDFVEHGAAFGVEPGVGLVEEQQSRPTGNGDGDREAPPLPCRQPSVDDVGKRLEPELLQRRIGVRDGRVGGADREPQVLPHGEVVVAARLVADERQGPTMGPPVVDQIAPEDLGFTRVDGDEAGQQSKERALACPVAAGDEDDFAGVDIEVDARERRKPVEEAHSGTKADDGLHRASPGVSEVYGAGRVGGEPLRERRGARHERP